MLNRLFFIFILIAFVSCDPVDTSLTLKNDTEKDFYYLIWGDSNTVSFYSDNSSIVNPSYKNFLTKISKGDEREDFRIGVNVWDKFFKNQTRNGKLNVFLYEHDTLQKYKWKTILKENKFSYYQGFSKSDLDSNSWRINFSKILK